MLPPGLSKRSDVRYALANGGEAPQAPAQQALIRLLQRRGPLRGKQIDQALPRSNWRPAAAALLRRGCLAREYVLDPPSVRPKHVRLAQLTDKGADYLASATEATRLARLTVERTRRLLAVLRYVREEGGPVEFSWIYASTRAALPDLKALAEHGLLALHEAETIRDPLADMDFVPAEPPELTEDQRGVWEKMEHGLGARDDGAQPLTPNPYLLHGVTCSGKTEIYLRAVERVLARGGQAIVLVPEIALTPQTIRRFASRFPGQVAVWHSRLSEGERYDAWRRARAGALGVLVGARSALFAPLPRLGLIVLDEEHDEAYKQDASAPAPVAYHTREAAVEYARRLGAVCLLGSATPDVASYQRAERGQYTLLKLPQRILGHGRRIADQARRLGVAAPVYRPANGGSEALTIDPPAVSVVDMRQELRAGNTSIFSRALETALEDALARGEQAILFLNRRGRSTYVFCRDCGHVLACPRCATPLAYHADVGQLICHHCNYRRASPPKCPRCGSPRIRHFGAGTQKVEAAVHDRFPEARTLRWDADTTRAKGAHDLILQQFAGRQAEVLIGTQMIAKGLDLPMVTLVGVISADTGLALPDYRAAERTFQVLTQVVGRAGRGLLGGRAILQTYRPDHYAIQAAAAQDFSLFYRKELAHRREFGYPPYGRLVRLTRRSAFADRLEAEARGLAEELRQRIARAERSATTLVGPAPCFFDRLAGEHRWQIILRGPDPASLLRGNLPRGWRIEVDPLSTL
jgi:primosomal protein N' (replication factor Y)